MKEVEANKKAWSLLSRDHYLHYKKRFQEGKYTLNPLVLKDLGDISGKRVLHLQCNTGADTIALAKLGAVVTGIDLVPKNVYYAAQLAKDLGIENVDFVESDIMKLTELNLGSYDIVFTSDGALGWLPDLNRWAKTVKHFLKSDGYLFVHDSHPFYLVFDESALEKGVAELKYPYFKKDPDEFDEIGGYASDEKKAKNYFWVYTMGSLINALAQSGLVVEFIHEYDRCVPGMGGTALDLEGLSYYPQMEGLFPLVFSLKAAVR